MPHEPGPMERRIEKCLITCFGYIPCCWLPCCENGFCCPFIGRSLCLALSAAALGVCTWATWSWGVEVIIDTTSHEYVQTDCQISRILLREDLPGEECEGHGGSCHVWMATNFSGNLFISETASRASTTCFCDNCGRLASGENLTDCTEPCFAKQKNGKIQDLTFDPAEASLTMGIIVSIAGGVFVVATGFFFLIALSNWLHGMRDGCCERQAQTFFC